MVENAARNAMLKLLIKRREGHCSSGTHLLRCAPVRTAIILNGLFLLLLFIIPVALPNK